MNEGLEALKYARIVDYTTDVALGKREPNKKLEESFNIIEKDLKAFEIIKPFLKNIRLEENEKGEYEILIDVVNSDKPLVIAMVNSKEEYDLLKEVLEQ